MSSSRFCLVAKTTTNYEPMQAGFFLLQGAASNEKQTWLRPD
jgi:hypothetical protein